MLAAECWPNSKRYARRLRRLRPGHRHGAREPENNNAADDDDGHLLRIRIEVWSGQTNEEVRGAVGLVGREPLSGGHDGGRGLSKRRRSFAPH